MSDLPGSLRGVGIAVRADLSNTRRSRGQAKAANGVRSEPQHVPNLISGLFTVGGADSVPRTLTRRPRGECLCVQRF